MPRKTLAFAALCLIWGSVWLAIPTLVAQVPPIRSTALRFTIAAAVLVPILVLRRVRLPRRRILIANLIFSATMIALPYALLLEAGTRVSSGITAVLFALMPLVAGLCANYLDGRRMPHSAMAALLLGLGGVLLITSNAMPASLEQVATAMVVLVGVISAGVSSVYAKRELTGVDPLMSSALQLGGGAVLLSVMSAMLERGQPSHWNPPAITALMFLSLGASAFAFPVYFWLLERVDAYQIGTIQWFEPLVAIAQAAILLGQPLSWQMGLGSAMVLVGGIRVMTSRDQDEVTLKITG